MSRSRDAAPPTEAGTDHSLQTITRGPPSVRRRTMALHRSLPAALAALLSSAVPAAAQEAAVETAQELKPLTIDDYGRWSRITSVALSPDGEWMTYAHSPNEGDGKLFIRLLDGETIHEIERGSGPQFSSDSRWVVYTISPPGEEGGAGGGRGGRGGGPPAQAGGRGGNGGSRTLQLLDLASGETFDVEDPQSSAFSEDARFLAIRRSSGGGDGYRGTDLVVRDLENGAVRNIGNVSDFAFNEDGSLLAWIVDASEKTGNGLYVMDPRSGVTRALDTDTLRYDRLSWNEDGTALAGLRGETPDNMEQRANTLIAYTDLTTESLAGVLGNGGNGGPSRNGVFVYDPAADPSFPADHVLSELGTLDWSRDGSKIFVGIKEQREEVEEDDDRANIEVWHWADERLQSVQKVRASADQRFTYAAVVHVPNGSFVRLSDEDMPRVQPTRDGRFAIGRRDAPYRMQLEEPGNRQDIVRITTATGSQVTLVEDIRYSMGVSHDGRWHAYSKDGTLFLQSFLTGETSDLAARAGVSFASDETGRPGETTTYGIAGWSRDNTALLVNGKYDVWMFPLAGGEPVNLTAGIGDRDDIRFRVIQLDRDEDEPGIDTSGPILLSAYGEWTKKSGYWTVTPGREPRPLLWEDRSIGQVRKAEDADRVIFTSQTFEEYPDWWVSDTRFRNPRKVTDANPQQAEYAWGSRVLVDYTDQRGNELQATLTLPAGYEAGQRYPMLVYFYERMSQRHYEYSFPAYDDRPHMSTYASDGYLVLMPDIVYDVGKPGSSALDDVTSAVRKVIELGYADPDRIGAQGHSWGGYESSFIVTQTDMFAATVTGAPLTNLESMHNILYKQSGGGNAPLIQWGQGRMGTVPWRDPEGYASQSPVRFVENISTPFMILHGTADGAVDWNQGLEFYVAARRAGKKVILLSYPDEPHHLRRKENQIDFQIRMKQYFDHYLKGEPAPHWLEKGVPYLERDREKRGGG